MDTPYFNTFLYSTVSLHPSQMTNDIYIHLKNNLIRKLVGKCYKSYGYISKIYKIEERSTGKLIAEDPTASASYDIKFSCKLCRPLKNTVIVCEVIQINKSLIYLRNGPIHVFIFEGSDNINKTNFVYDERRNVLLAVIGNGKGIPVVIGTYIKIKVDDCRIENGSNKIIVLGILESLATKNDIDDSLLIRENDNIPFVEYDEYLTKESEHNNTSSNINEDDTTHDENDDETDT
jgi:DNA-directed RNA polymerase subunit E'/Rpb7